AEDDRDLLALPSHLRDLLDGCPKRQGVALDAVMAAGQSEHEVRVGHRVRQRVGTLRRLENVLRVVGDADHLPGVEAHRTDKPQSKEAVVGHGPHHAADIYGVSRFDQYDRDSVEPLRWAPALGRGRERERFIATADWILCLSALETRTLLGQQPD